MKTLATPGYRKRGRQMASVTKLSCPRLNEMVPRERLVTQLDAARSRYAVIWNDSIAQVADWTTKTQVRRLIDSTPK